MKVLKLFVNLACKTVDDFCSYETQKDRYGGACFPKGGRLTKQEKSYFGL